MWGWFFGDIFSSFSGLFGGWNSSNSSSKTNQTTKNNNKNLQTNQSQQLNNNIGSYTYSSPPSSNKIQYISEDIKWVVDEQTINSLKSIKDNSLNDIGNDIASDLKNKLWLTNIDKLDFSVNYNPNNVVSFGDIREYTQKIINDYKIIFKCGYSNFRDKICDKIDDLENSLWSIKTINHIYKLLMILNVIQKYEAVYMLYNSIKGWTLMFTVDKNRDIISEIDFIRTYSTPSSRTNDYIVFWNNEAEINVTTTPPTCGQNEVCFILWLRNNIIQSFKIYPLDTDKNYWNVNMFKVMKIKQMKNDINCNFTDSVWKYTNGSWTITEIGMWHNWQDLIPQWSWYSWIEFDLVNGCFKVEK